MIGSVPFTRERPAFFEQECAAVGRQLRSSRRCTSGKPRRESVSGSLHGATRGAAARARSQRTVMVPGSPRRARASSESHHSPQNENAEFRDCWLLPLGLISFV